MDLYYYLQKSKRKSDLPKKKDTNKIFELLQTPPGIR